MKYKNSLRFGSVLAGVVFSCVCAVPSSGYAMPALPPFGVSVGVEVYPNVAPPPLIQEPAIVSPGPGFVWIPGTWVWNDHWVWEKGRWERPPHPGAVWVPHHYEYRKGRHVFTHGGWR